ncbi:hypothetical protein E4U56_006226 [Claviceps arundinis]|uniref:Myb-like domain-containing protein n=1 Tax=Claviceps arundinis TaxID=1623583 RepID=A0A9P7MLD3_9HYPO|nr:hypothetical protein E4U56_006226 [Claviceps arundinis]
MDHFVELYESHKAEMWAKLAEEMSVPWTEAEANHWRLGKAEIRKRSSDDSFSTVRVDLSHLHVDEAEVQSRRQQQDPDQQQQGQQQQDEQKLQRVAEWSGKEETLLYACKRAGKSWEEIAEYLPERTIMSCKAYYYRLLKRCGGWSPELQNKLCRIYERLKPEMWAKIGQDLLIGWGCAEEMHWRLRVRIMAERAGILPVSQPAANFAPSRIPDADAHQTRYQEHDRIQQLPRHTTYPLSQAGTLLTMSEERFRSPVTLPSFAAFTAGVDLSFRPHPKET